MADPVSGIAGKTALITGGGRGLGFAAARALGAAGARLVITGRNMADLNEAARVLEDAGVQVLALRNELSDTAAVSELVDQIMDRCAPIDILINNAGTTWGEAASTHDRQSWNRVVAVNLNGTFALTQAVAAKSMFPRGRGVIVFVASIAALGGNQAGGVPTVAYNATKAAQVNLARSLAAEWGPHGIRVNALMPGWFVSKMTQRTLDAHHDQFLGRIPLGRFGDADADLAGPILFLASDASRYVTGTTLVVDGGMTCTV